MLKTITSDTIYASAKAMAALILVSEKKSNLIDLIAK
jgi:hypothetical protein